MVGACVLNIIINIFQPNNYGQLSGNSAFRQVALKWFSNTWCKLHVLLYSYGMCAVAITQIRLYICTGKTFFTVYLFHERQLFTSWFNCINDDEACQ